MDDGAAGGLDGDDAGTIVEVPGIGVIRVYLDAEGKPVDHAERLHALGNGVVRYAAGWAFAVLWDRITAEARAELDTDAPACA